jgi:tetratricopeptide (TPR) repeat protein
VGEYGEIPPDLPALWVALGQADRAESLTRSVADHDRVQVLAKLAGPMAAGGDPGRAERLLRSIGIRRGQIREPFDKTWAWTDLAWLAAISGDRDRAARLIGQAYAEARSVTTPYLRAQLLLGWARVFAAFGDRSRADEFLDRAQALVTGELNEPTWWQWVLDALPVIVTGTGDLDRAEALVGTVPDRYPRARAAAQLAAMVAVQGEYRRAEKLLGTITDEYRQGRVRDALHAIRAVASPRTDGSGPDIGAYRRARALANLAEVVAAGGSGHAWGVSDRAEPLVRYEADHNDQMLIFAALAAGAAQGDSGRAAALAGRAEAIVAAIDDPEDQPPALATLAWIVADAGDPVRAAELVGAAEALVRYTRRHLKTWRVADLAAMARAAAGERRADTLPELIGTPKQQKFAQDLRAGYVSGRWGSVIPAEAMAQLTRLTEARWWIENRDDLDAALGKRAGIWNDDDLPPIAGSPKQEDWARKLPATLSAEGGPKVSRPRSRLHSPG